MELAHRSQRALVIDVCALEISLAERERERQEGKRKEKTSRGRASCFDVKRKSFGE